MKTIMNEVLEKTNAKEKYDASCKLVLSQKIILARILKDYLPEYEGVSLEEVAGKYIEGEPKVSRIDVPMIHGIRTEDTDIDEGTVSGDIRFRANVPEHDVGIFNIEAQGSFHEKYSMIKRGTYYLGRMISSQRGTEFTGSDYDDLKMVYVIWIFLDPPKKWKNSVVFYEVKERQYIGSGEFDSKKYDLMTQIFIGLGDPDQPEAVGALRLLDVLFSERIDLEEKKRILESEFQIPMTEELEKGVDTMCNFSDAVERRGILKGLTKGLEKGRAVGREEGRMEGRSEMKTLYERLITEGRMEDLIRANRDDMFYQQLMDEYGLSFVN